MGEDIYRAYGKFVCSLNAQPIKIHTSKVTAAIKRGFKYRRSFDVG